MNQAVIFEAKAPYADAIFHSFIIEPIKKFRFNIQYIEISRDDAKLKSLGVLKTAKNEREMSLHLSRSHIFVHLDGR